MQFSEQSREYIINSLKRRSTITEDGHWLWNSYKHKSGHAKIAWNGNHIFLGRLSLHLFKNFDLNSKKLALHIVACREHSCWCPEHLYVGDYQDNQRDAVATNTHWESKKTNCPQGHPYDADNTRIKTNGKRVCKICDNKRRNKNYYKRKTRLKESRVIQNATNNERL